MQTQLRRVHITTLHVTALASPRTSNQWLSRSGQASKGGWWRTHAALSSGALSSSHKSWLARRQRVSKLSMATVSAGGAARQLTAAIVADLSTANGKNLVELLPQLRSCAGGVQLVVGNDLDAFRTSPLLPDVDFIAHAAFAGGSAALIAELWKYCPKVRWVHSLSAGVETLVPVINSLPGASEIPVTNAKGAFSWSLAEFAIAAMLHFNKQIPRLQEQKATRTWDKFIMAELRGKTVGFVGFGNISQTTVPLCRAFGMRVLALRNSRGAKGDNLADEVFVADEPEGRLAVFRESDFVVCALPGGEATRHFCGRAEFQAMKPSAVFISIGRGTCVDEASLVAALREKAIAGAALDVFEEEPLPQDAVVWDCPNFLLSPHNADLTEDYMQLTWNKFLEKVDHFARPDFAGFDDTVDKVKGY